jgi:cell division protein FtsZ
LRRLAAVGLGRREDEEQPAGPMNVRPVRSGPRPSETPSPRVPMPAPLPRMPEPVSEYAKRSAPQPPDPLGRQVPVNNSTDDDQLEIPAFLRRQAN